MSQSLNFRERCIAFSAEVIQQVSALRRTATGRHIAEQLLRSATSIGANVHEARGAESRADFIHKIQVALKEARETHYWLSVVHQSKLLPDFSIGNLSKECNELCAILARSAITARQNGNRTAGERQGS